MTGRRPTLEATMFLTELGSGWLGRMKQKVLSVYLSWKGILFSPRLPEAEAVNA